jgi:hypothetical protein
MSTRPAPRLGPGHPLARDLESLEVVGGHAVAVLAALLCGAAAAMLGEPWGLPVVLGAKLALAGLGVAAVVVHVRTRRHALELVLEGEETLPLRAVERERERLLGAKRRGQLSRRLLDVADEAQRAPTFAPLPMPPNFDVPVVRAVGPDLRRLAARLERPSHSARAVALIERLVCSGSSPLYGDDPAALREELRRLEHLLSR